MEPGQVNVVFVEDLSWETIASMIRELNHTCVYTPPILDRIAERVAYSDKYFMALIKQLPDTLYTENVKANTKYLLDKVAQLRVESRQQQPTG